MSPNAMMRKYPRDHVDQQGRDANHNAGHRQCSLLRVCFDLVDGDRAEHDAHVIEPMLKHTDERRDQ